MSIQDPGADDTPTADRFAEVTVRYDHTMAEAALAQVKRTVIIMMIVSVLCIALMLYLAFGVFDGTSRMVLVLVAIMAVATQLILLPRIMLMANQKATEAYTHQGVAFTMGTEGIRLPDAMRTMSLHWHEISLGPAGTESHPSEVMLRLVAGDDERIYLRDALTPDADTVLETAARLRG